MILPYIYPDITDLAAGGGSYALPDCISLTVVEERNGAFELELQYLYAGQNASEIQTERIIMSVTQKDGDFEPFRVYEVTTPIDGVITVKAHHLSYDLSGVYLTPFLKTGISNVLNELNGQLALQNPFFELRTDIVNTTSQLSTSYPHSLFSMIGGNHSLVSVFGGELDYHWDSSQAKMIITLKAQRGDTSNATIAYGVNLLTLDAKENAENVYSAIYPFAKIEVSGNMTLVTLPEETISTGSSTTQTKVLVKDFSSEFDHLPTVAELRQMCNDYIASHVFDPQSSVSFDFVPLENTTEYAGQEEYDLDLCDTVNVSADVIGVAATAQIVRTVYNPLKEKYDSMTVGAVEQTIADTIVEIDAKSTDDSGVPVEYVPAEDISITADTVNTVSIPNSTWTAATSITIDEGTYLVVGYCQFETSATGIRRIVISDTSGSTTQISRGAISSGNALSSANSDETCIVFLTINATTTLYLNVYQNSGSARSVFPRLSALRVK